MNIPKDTKIFKQINGENVLAISYSQLSTFLQCPMKWKLSYLDGIRFDEQYEALDYGLCIHETYEYYAKNKAVGKKLELAEMEGVFNNIFTEKDIQFSDEKSEQQAILDGMSAIKRLTDNGGYIESLINKSTILAVEEEFILPIQHVVDIDDNLFDCVYVFGAIDLILEKSNGDIVIIDHKSGKTKFKKDKLETDLQFPLYGNYINKKYGKLPKKCFYNFTRLSDFQEVILDEDKIIESEKTVKNIINRMYNGNTYKPVPTPLCYWCDFSKTKHKTCKASSDWIPKSEREQ